MVAVSQTSTVELERPSNGSKRRSAVLITGRGTDVAFNLDENAPLDDLARDLDNQLAGQTTLFSEGGITVNTGNRSLSSDEEEEIRRIFRDKSGLKIARFISLKEDVSRRPVVELAEPTIEFEEPPALRAGRQSRSLSEFSSADLARALSGLSPQSQRTNYRADGGPGETVRSGETVVHAGDLVVLGDVNPGSEIVADGDIVVMGALKGLAHAGASGDSKAAVIALEISSPRLRIGNVSADAPASQDAKGGRKRKQTSTEPQPKIAFVRRGEIYVSPFAGRFARNTKGVPYEG